MNDPFDLQAVQDALREQNVDGWLFAQFHGRDPLADRVLGLHHVGLQSRRWYYFVPTVGEPRKLVHAIEPAALDDVPGPRESYRTWGELEGGISKLLEGVGKVAMQYSPMNNIPPVAMVDAGTIELIKKTGVDVVSAADLVQRFTATLNDAAIASHRQAGKVLPEVMLAAFREVRRCLLAGEDLTEYDLQQYILQQIQAVGLTTPDDPIVAVNEHAADPHYAPGEEDSSPIRRGDWLLLDMWAKEPGEGKVFADISWTAQVDDTVPEERVKVFEAVREARDAALQLIRDRYEAEEPVYGFEADRAAREVLVAAGFGQWIQHRTGHSITDEIHGSGANLDDFETHDDRRLMRRTCFSIEPGIYIDEAGFGARSEIDVLIPPTGPPEVCGMMQDEMILLLADEMPPVLVES
jgi:Xaa-Pro aminopeptidase